MKGETPDPFKLVEKLKPSELSESIRRTFEDHREAQAVERSKPNIIFWLQMMALKYRRKDGKKYDYLCSLIVETHSATKKEHIDKILESARNLLDV